jgi:hypothetical protein
VIASIELEITLGVWLLSGWFQRGAWLGALGFFGVLAGVSLYLALIGQRSCGCFGRVPVNPWLTFTLDVWLLMSSAGHHSLPSVVISQKMVLPTRNARMSSFDLHPFSQDRLMIRGTASGHSAGE